MAGIQQAAGRAYIERSQELRDLSDFMREQRERERARTEQGIAQIDGVLGNFWRVRDMPDEQIAGLKDQRAQWKRSLGHADADAPVPDVRDITFAQDYDHWRIEAAKLKDLTPAARELLIQSHVAAFKLKYGDWGLRKVLDAQAPPPPTSIEEGGKNKAKAEAGPPQQVQEPASLSAGDEAKFQEWNAWQAQARGKNASTDPAVQQYDMRAYWAKYRPVVGEFGGGAGPQADHGGEMRFSDEFKTTPHEGTPSGGSGLPSVDERLRGVFDKMFPPAVAETIDPQRRMLLEYRLKGLQELPADTDPAQRKFIINAMAAEFKDLITPEEIEARAKVRPTLSPEAVTNIAAVSWGDATPEQKTTIAKMYNLSVPEADALMALRTAGETKTAAEEEVKAQEAGDRKTTIANLAKSPKAVDKRVAAIMRASPGLKVDEAYSQADREATETRQTGEFAQSHALASASEARQAAEAKKKAAAEGEGGYTVDQSRVMNDIQQTEARLNGGVIYDEIRGVNITVPKTEDATERAMLETRLRGLRKQGRAMKLSAEVVGQVGPTANSDWGQDFGRLPGPARNWALEMRRQGKKSAWIKQGLLDKGYSW